MATPPLHPRRTFLKSAAAATALSASGLTLTPLGHGQTGPAPAPARAPIRVGFLGTTHSHFREKHRVLRESADWQVVGLCDPAIPEGSPRPDVAGAHWITEPELMAQAEVVVVEASVRNLAPFAERALAAGKHVHVEKPPAPSVAGLTKLIELAGRQRRLLQVGYMWRHNPGFTLALDAARSGWLGRVFLFRATMNTQAGPEQRREWAEFPGGAMFEQGCHLIDPMVRLLGRPLKVTPFLQKTAPHQDALADNCVAVFEFASALGIITSAPLQPNAGAHRFLEILGTEGTARVQPIEPPAIQLDLAKAAEPFPKGPSRPEVGPYRRYVDEFATLARAIRTNAPLPISTETEQLVHETVIAACTPRP